MCLDGCFGEVDREVGSDVVEQLSHVACDTWGDWLIVSGEMGSNLESTRELLQLSVSKSFCTSCFGSGGDVKEVGERSGIGVQGGDGGLVDGDDLSYPVSCCGVVIECSRREAAVGEEFW